MIRNGLLCLSLVIAVCSLSCSEPESTVSAFRNAGVPVERRVEDLIRRLRPDEKLALLRGAANDRLGIPARKVVEGAMGVSARDASGQPIATTAFPANIGMAATWDPGMMEQVGSVVGQQAKALGLGQVLGPLAEIIRSPRSGRVFESYGEDPWLAGRMVSAFISGVQSEGEIATAIYPGGSADTRSARESELRPLEAAVTEGGVWAVMPRDGNPPGNFLKGDLGFRGFTVPPVMEHDRSIIVADEDNEDNEVRGVLRAMFASGVFDRETKSSREVETPAHRALARAAAAQSIVLLKNEGGLLPLDAHRIHRLAVIGPNAAVNRMAGGSYTVAGRYSDPPLAALRAVFGSRVLDAASPADAANADAAIVFAGTGAQTEGEGMDRSSLSLPAGQDELIQAVAKANRNTIVVLIAGYPVATEKWIGDVPAVLDAWFPGEEGGHAIADVLSGAVNPAGRLPVGLGGSSGAVYPFGFGLSYTRFELTDLAVTPSVVLSGQFVEVSATVRNTGSRAGKETVQLYLRVLHSEVPIDRSGPVLRGFEQVDLKPGEEKRVRFTLTGEATRRFDEERQDWVQDRAVYEVRVASSSRDPGITGTFEMAE